MSMEMRQGHRDEASPRPAQMQTMPWWRQFGRQVITLWWLKALGTSALMWGFFQFYFALLDAPWFEPMVMRQTGVDALIPFWPPAVGLYFSLWVYVSLPGALQSDWPRLFWHGLCMAVLCAIGLAFYAMLPTTFVSVGVDWPPGSWGQILETVDKPGNAFPSMHVAVAVSAAIWLQHELGRIQAPWWTRALNWLWCAGIALSTLLTKQHVFWDVMGGLLLGPLAGWLSVALIPHWLAWRQRHRPLLKWLGL